MSRVSDILETIGEESLSELKREWNDQGHHLTGKTEGEFRKESLKTSTGYELNIYGSDVAVIQDRGVPAGKIPYSGRSGRGGKSKYIEALEKYAQLRGMADPKRAAFAIAAAQKRDGMATVRSKRFSKTGRRQGFIQDALKQKQTEYGMRIAEAKSAELLEHFGTIFKFGT